jgi:uncharacterized protein YndB with AHSA1/START domain
MHITREPAAITIEEHTRSSTGEDTMSNTYERTFVVSVPVERAWRAFVDPKERENYVAAPGRSGDAWEAGELPSITPGVAPVQIEIGDVEPLRAINYREGVRMRWADGDDTVTDWLDVSVTFEEAGSGTRITFTRSGFGDSEEWRIRREAQCLGQDETLADLVFYLETGVPVHALRHYAAGAGDIGATFLESTRGVEMVRIVPGGFAEAAGLRAGDTLVRLAGAAIYRRADILAVQRSCGAGAAVEVTYVREGRVMHGEAELSESNYTVSQQARGA